MNFEEAHKAFEGLPDKYPALNENPLYNGIRHDLNSVKNHCKKISLKTFMNDADSILTCQFSERDIWSPGIPRKVERFATYFTLQGSRREYARVIGIAASDQVGLFYDRDMETFLLYKKVED